MANKNEVGDIMRTRLEESLKKLDDDLIKMGTLIEQSIGKVFTAFKYRDKKLLSEIKSEEVQTDELEREIEGRAMRILVSQQPVAGDLRKVSSALKMITDMERIADQSVDIAEIVQNFMDKPEIAIPDHIVKMAKQAVIMVSESIDAFVTGDLERAYKVIRSDDIVDDLFIQARQNLVQLIHDNPQNGEYSVDFIMIAKYLERIADHAVNIALWVIYNLTGEHKSKHL